MRGRDSELVNRMVASNVVLNAMHPGGHRSTMMAMLDCPQRFLAIRICTNDWDLNSLHNYNMWAAQW